MRLIIKRILSNISTSLPVTKAEYDSWLESIVELTGPIADKASLEWVVSNEVMRAQSGKDTIPKAVFVRALRKFACNQLAANKVLELKEQQAQKQQEEAALEAAKQSGETQTAQS
jgi:hypothetical protein